MIGGHDIVFAVSGDSVIMEQCARIVGQHWQDIRFEDALSGDKYRCVSDIPFGRVSDLLAYPNAEAEMAWDEDRLDAPVNSLLYLIVRPQDITIVVDEPNADEMQAILGAIRQRLWAEYSNTYASAA